jgi:hypothetical protein
MNRENLLPETSETWRRMCTYWAKIIQMKGESGVHIWPPCDSSYYQVRRFFADKEIQSELLHGLKLRMAIIDGYEQEQISFDDLEQQIVQSFGFGGKEAASLEDLLKNSSDELFVLFVTGFDTVLKHANTVSLQKLATLPSRYTHSNLKIIFFTEFNILDSASYSILVRSSNLLQNVAYEPLLGAADIAQFSYYIATRWNIVLPDWFTPFLTEEIGGHPLLIKEAVRLFRDNEKIVKAEILSNSSLMRKAVAVFDRLSDADKVTVRLILQGEKSVDTSEYLYETKVVVNNNIGIPYWRHIKQKLVSSISQHASHSVDFYLTSTERDVLTLLLETKQIVTREQVAEHIWHENWEEKYSDWAIDQLMHRLREKLSLTKSPYTIQTKKGQGFFLVRLSVDMRTK